MKKICTRYKAYETVRQMQSEGFEYDAINQYCTEVYGEYYAGNIKKRTMLMNDFINTWCAKEFIPFKLPPYNN